MNHLIDGRYSVVRTLGRGASAQTFACQDLEENGRAVAVKEMTITGADGWKSLELFEREGQVLLSLDHPGVPKVFRCFEAQHPDGAVAFYLVMELVAGPSLRDRIDLPPALAEADVVSIASGVLDVLDYLHSRLPPVFHRDIKPSNIVLRDSTAPVLVDFGGVAHGWRKPEGGSTVTGTFGYMPPEQLLGQVSPASDLYALGATLLHVVTGRAPTEFSLDSGRLTVPDDAPVSPRLRRFIDALLAPAPRDRPASARAALSLLLETTELIVPSAIDVSHQPRDPGAALRDVYLNLTNPWGNTPNTVTPMRRLLNGAGWILLGLASAGTIFVAYAGNRFWRWRRFAPLFRTGRATTGLIANVVLSNRGPLATFVYDYDVDGTRWRATISYPKALALTWSIGSPVTVLYDPSNPGRSCIVYRQPASQ